MASPHTISPMYSAWARNECTVALTSPLVCRFTQMAPMVRVSGRRDPRDEQHGRAATDFLGGAGYADEPDRSSCAGNGVAAQRCADVVDMRLHDSQGGRAHEQGEDAEGGEPHDGIRRKPHVDEPPRA